MDITHAHLHKLIDNINSTELDIVYKILIKFISEDTPIQDEIEAIRKGKESIEKEGCIKHEDIVWK